VNNRRPVGAGIWASKQLLLTLACATTLGCSTSAPGDTPELPWPRQAFPEAVVPSDNPSTAAKIELGRMLFYDPVLSSDGEVACATCHSELWGLSDGLPLSVGVDGDGPVGPGRTGPNVTSRNAPTLWNVALRESLFWDGRVASLEDQALEPIQNEIEMNRDLVLVLADLRNIDGYRNLFKVAFPDTAEPINGTNLARALAAFQRTFISNLSPYDRYVAGDHGALRPEARKGMFLFAEAGCHHCHTPPLFERELYAARGIDSPDIGHQEVSGKSEDRGAFRVPTLRNLRETGPYFHDGSVANLLDAVSLEVERATNDKASRPMDAEEVAAIAEFIHKGLMDRSREPDRPESVPSGLAVPLDGFRIPR